MAGSWVSVDEVTTHRGVVKGSVSRGLEKRRLPARRIGGLWKPWLVEVGEGVRVAGAAESNSDEKTAKRGGSGQ